MKIGAVKSDRGLDFIPLFWTFVALSLVLVAGLIVGERRRRRAP